MSTIPKLSVSPDGHFFQGEEGQPFFLLADTAWLLFNKLHAEEIRHLFENRARKGFNAVLAVVFRDLFTPNSPNVYGVTPFASEEDMYAVRMNPEWIAFVRRMIDVAAEYGLFIGLLPTWGDKWNEHSNSAGPVIMDREGSRAYGRFLSDALADCPNIIWVLGGDSPIQTQEHADTLQAIAEGVRSGGAGDRLMTFHPCHNAASDIFHAAGWLDFNVIQSGHARPNIADYLYIDQMWRLEPPKPCLNMEANFEDCPMFLMMREKHHPAPEPLFSAYDVRKCLYRSVLAGGAGFVYGCEPIRQIYREGDKVHVYWHYQMPPWHTALDAAGSVQLQHLVRLLSERSYFSRVPAQELLLPIQRFQGVGMDFTVQENRDPVAHVRVAGCSKGTYLMAYIPVRQGIMLDTSGLKSETLHVSLYDPETGETTSSYEHPNHGTVTLVPQRDLDTFVVIDALG